MERTTMLCGDTSEISLNELCASSAPTAGIVERVGEVGERPRELVPVNLTRLERAVELLLAERRQLQEDDSAVGLRASPAYETGGRCTIDEPRDGVVAELEHPRELAERDGLGPAGRTLDEEQQQILARRDPALVRRRLGAPEELAQSEPERCYALDVALAEPAGHSADDNLLRRSAPEPVAEREPSAERGEVAGAADRF